MIKKMILEEVAKLQKKIALIDIDFSKAYDSTEKFAKDITLRRMGFPEEGLDPNLFGWYSSSNILIYHLLGVHLLGKAIKWHCDFMSLELRSKVCISTINERNGLGVSRDLGTFSRV